MKIENSILENQSNQESLKLLKVKEVAQILRVNVNKVYDLIRKGHITALKLGDLKVTRFELTRFINEASGKDFTDLDNIKNFNPSEDFS
ncbi:helix-turn-helix domain-containing protein [Tepidibacter hydrothermalis]|uniref:Helix-turn-helix domain-containing protein n=1 Tax=Tepidibacter hydrothermalis TaxID=3036126 RepID=A0ABY8EA30_9FIRM|nr:helix-turn-helix domain-containing protein [Tepidibacter hydrothermalis]WFD09772.1 helix-turn-helix domain-containing protein [Tepidibacter hydrothermalis]